MDGSFRDERSSILQRSTVRFSPNGISHGAGNETVLPLSKHFDFKKYFMMEFFNFMFRSFWTFIGCSLLIAGTGSYLLVAWNRFWRHFNIRKHGYPPPHCDADGDFKEKE